MRTEFLYTDYDVVDVHRFVACAAAQAEPGALACAVDNLSDVLSECSPLERLDVARAAVRREAAGSWAEFLLGAWAQQLRVPVWLRLAFPITEAAS